MTRLGSVYSDSHTITPEQLLVFNPKCKKLSPASGDDSSATRSAEGRQGGARRISLQSSNGTCRLNNQRIIVPMLLQENLKVYFEQLLSEESTRARLRDTLKKFGFDTTDWVRVVMYRRCFEFIGTLKPETLDVLEISGGPQWRRAFKFGSYSESHYPDFDICSQALDRQFDLIIADQVFEHLPWPNKAARNVFAMLRSGGTFIIATPFLIRVHNSPIDCSRWTETGLSYLLQDGGFPEGNIKTDSWGNRACLRANLAKWRRYGWYRSLRNEPNYPVMIWAFARKP
jgi:SAM-dependent methyltransferase